jgi:cytochrome c5
MIPSRIFTVVRRAVFALLAVSASGFADDAAKPGDRTVAQVCSVCHGGGLMGAPEIGDKSAWSRRLKSAGSLDTLVESAKRGKGNMPARGGETALTDADLKAAIQYMLDKSGVGG